MSSFEHVHQAISDLEKNVSRQGNSTEPQLSNTTNAVLQQFNLLRRKNPKLSDEAAALLVIASAIAAGGHR